MIKVKKSNITSSLSGKTFDLTYNLVHAAYISLKLAINPNAKVNGLNQSKCHACGVIYLSRIFRLQWLPMGFAYLSPNMLKTRLYTSRSFGYCGDIKNS